MTVETLKKKWLWHYIKPKYFYIPVKDTNNQGTVKFSFYKPTYYESDVFNYVESVSIIIFKNDINKIYVTQSSTTNGVINLELPIGNYFMYITSIKGCVLTETKYEFEISKNQETVVNINFDLAFYRATVTEDNDPYFNFSMTDERPCYWAIVDENGKSKHNRYFTSISGSKNIAMIVYDEKNNYKGKVNSGTSSLDWYLAPYIISPSETPLLCSCSWYCYDIYDGKDIALQHVNVEVILTIDYNNLFSFENYELMVNCKYYRKTTKLKTYKDGTSNTEIIEENRNTVVTFLFHTWDYSYYSGDYIVSYVSASEFNILIPQNIVLSSTPININYGKRYIFKDNLTAEDMILLSQANNIFMSDEGVLVNKKKADNNFVYISQGNRTFECSFHDKISEMVNQGKWID